MQSIPLDDKQVNNLIKQCRHLNIFPDELDYIFLQKNIPSIYEILAMIVADCQQYLEIISPEEIEALVEKLPFFYQERIDYKTSWLTKPDLLEKVSLYYVIWVVSQTYFSIKDLLALHPPDSEVLKIYPELSEKFDDDGLLRIDRDISLHPMGLLYQNHLLHFHQFLRRGYQSNPNFDFLGKFLQYAKITYIDNSFRIAIDHRRLMPREFMRLIGERDVWFGVPFDKTKLDDRNAVGITVVGRNKPSPFDSSYKLEKTEFYWNYKDGIKTFEIEEISDETELRENYVLNKYIHAERDIEAKILRHFDGAVKVYLRDNYGDRKLSKIKSFRKTKLFRIDGDIDLDVWSELISLFFKGNEMILEYFNPAVFEQTFGEKIRHYQQVMQDRAGKI